VKRHPHEERGGAIRSTVKTTFNQAGQPTPDLSTDHTEGEQRDRNRYQQHRAAQNGAEKICYPPAEVMRSLATSIEKISRSVHTLGGPKQDKPLDEGDFDKDR